LQKALVPKAELLGTETPSETTNVAMTTPVASAVLEVATRRLVRVNTVTLPRKERHGELLRVALFVGAIPMAPTPPVQQVVPTKASDAVAPIEP
jgi:hypothetical protein